MYARTQWRRARGAARLGEVRAERIGRRGLFALVGAGAGAWLVARALPRAAAQAAPVTLAELRAASDCCVLGRTMAAESRWMVIAGARRIATDHRLQIDEVFEGATEAREITVRTLGGRVGRIGQRAFGEAQLRPGAQAVLFLARIEPGLYVVTDMAGGHFPVEQRAGAMHMRAVAGAPATELSGAPLSVLRARLLQTPGGALHAP